MNTSLFDAEDIQRLAGFIRSLQSEPVSDKGFTALRQAVLISHTHPDGDAVGSCLAMSRYLSELGLSSVIVVPTAAPETISFIFKQGDCRVIAAQDSPEEASKAVSEAGLIICQDLANIGRACEVEAAFRSASCPKVLIDHHQNPAREDFDTVFSTEKISSTCELLFYVLEALHNDCQDMPASPLESLDALMAGMTTDTNNFSNSVFPSTLEMASICLERGVDRDSIIAHLQQEYSESRFRLQGYYLSEKLRISEKGVAYAVFSAEELKSFNIHEGETEGFVNIPLGIKKVKMSLFLREDGGVFRVSLRSKKGVSASRLAAQSFNGGGHEMAAGGRLEIGGAIRGVEDAEAYVLKVTNEYFD